MAGGPSAFRRLLSWVRIRMPWVALIGVGVSAVIFVIGLPRHAARGSWGDLVEVAAYNWWPVILLLLVGFLARGRTIFHAVGGWFSGYFLSMALVFLILEPIDDWMGVDSRWDSAVLTPIIEEAAKALPLLILYAAVRRLSWIKPTVTDFAVLGLAIGGGFAFHEDALWARVLSGGWEGWGLLFPTIVQAPIFAVGHGVWTGLVGLGIGVALARRGRSLAWLVPLAAFVLVTVDHGLINADWSRSALLDGRLPLYVLLVGIAWALTVEMRVLARAAGGGTALLAGLRTALETVRSAPGLIGTVRQWQLFVLALRLAILQMWSTHTQLVTAQALAPPGAGAVDRSAASTTPVGDSLLPPGAEPSPADGDSRRGVLIGLLVLAVAVSALVVWQLRDDGSEMADKAAVAETNDGDAVDSTPSRSAGDVGESPTLEFANGPVFTSPVLLRWEREDARGPGADTVLVVDGERELLIDGGVLQYREGDQYVFCSESRFAEPPDNMVCNAQPATGSLASFLALATNADPDLPGAYTELRTIAGRETFCVYVPIGDDDDFYLTCSDTETGMTLLLESKGKTLTGGETYSRQQLVEWSTPDESDFTLPPEAEAALNAS